MSMVGRMSEGGRTMAGQLSLAEIWFALLVRYRGWNPNFLRTLQVTIWFSDQGRPFQEVC